jgi:hypothetical protein
METNIENQNSLKLEKQSIALDENDDSTALKEKFGKLAEAYNSAFEVHEKVSSLNRQLYERAKKAEGFEQNEKGEWIKDQRPSKKNEPVGMPKPEENELLQKTFLRAAQITADDEVNLAFDISKKWNMPIDKLVDDADFKVKLEKLRIDKANVLAASGKGGGGGTGNAKADPQTYISRGEPPTPDEVPDRKERIKIYDAMSGKGQSKVKFYNQK